MKIPGVFKNLIVLAITCALFFIIVEAGFKVLHIFSDPEVGPTDIAGLPYENTPNGWFLRYEPSNGWIFYRNNSLGMRDVERTYDKPADVKRVVCLGDSVIFGGEVSFDQIFSRQLEGMLKEDQEALEVEVLNCGTTSYSVREYMVYLKEKGLKFDPDLVIVGICLNDYKSLFVQGAPLANMGASGIVTGATRWERQLAKLKRFLFHSYFLEYLEKVKKTLSARQQGEWQNELAKAVDPGAWAGTRDYFIGIKEICDARDIPLIVVIFPYADQLDDYAPGAQPQKYIVSMLRDLKIDNIDLLPAYAASYKSGGKIYSRFDGGHPLPLGHELAARMAKERIKEKNLLQ